MDHVSVVLAECLWSLPVETYFHPALVCAVPNKTVHLIQSGFDTLWCRGVPLSHHLKTTTVAVAEAKLSVPPVIYNSSVIQNSMICCRSMPWCPVVNKK